MKLRKKNKGFTLIEVCIASAILAIAISPFVANFIQSSKMNLKSRKDLNAMNLAQDIFEGASVYTAKELTTDVLGNPANIARILPTGANYDSANSTGGLKTYNSAPAGQPANNVTIDKLYEYNIKDVETVIGTALNKYNVRITLDGRDTDKEGGNAPINGAYPVRDYANISNIDGYYDAIYTIPTTEYNSAITYLKDGINGVDEEQYKGHIYRTIDITIKNEPVGGADSYSVSVKRNYKSSGTVPALGTNVKEFTENNISKTDPTEMPSSVYLYFEGVQRDTSEGTLETINITNTTGKDIVVYLIRTIKEPANIDVGYVDGSPEWNYNANYRCNVNILSNETVDSNGKPCGFTKIVSNLRYNLAAKPELNFRPYKEGTVDKTNPDNLARNVVLDASQITPNGDEKVASTSKYDAARCVYRYSNTAQPADLAIMDENKYTQIVSDGYKIKEDASKVYRATVEIFEKDFSESNRVAIYTGSVVD